MAGAFQYVNKIFCIMVIFLKGWKLMSALRPYECYLLAVFGMQISFCYELGSEDTHECLAVKYIYLLFFSIEEKW